MKHIYRLQRLTEIVDNIPDNSTSQAVPWCRLELEKAVRDMRSMVDDTIKVGRLLNLKEF